MIFIDESSSDLHMENNYARAEGGDRVKTPKPIVRGQKFSLLSAVGIFGIIEFLYVELSVTASIFIHFIAKMLCPKLKKGQIVLIDNAKIHKSSKIRIAIEKAGAILVYLPPYSPDLSPIEKMWSKLKYFIKKLKPRTQEEFYNALTSAISTLDVSDFEEWYEECGYMFD